jgi:DNA-binding response OmpR family regulator
MPSRVLILEEPGSLSQELAAQFLLHNLAYECTADISTAVALLEAVPFDTILIDEPSEVGNVCGQLRKAGLPAPLIVLSKDARPEAKIAALYAGADDYLSKPFDPGEVIARIHALRRRAAAIRAHALTEYQFGNVYVNFITGTACKNGAPLELSVKELRLLHFLIARQRSVVSREQLLHHVWGYCAQDTRTIDVHVAAIRRKLEDDPQHPNFILTVRGQGYRFQDAPCKELLT